MATVDTTSYEIRDETRDRVTFRLSRTVLNELDDLADEGVFESRSAALRAGALNMVESHSDRRIDP